MNWITKILAHEAWDVIIPEADRKWLGTTLHHTAYISDDDQGKYLEDLHLNGKREGYPPFKHGMGYHFVVNRGGSIQIGKRWRMQLHGAHTIGYNQDYIGISLAGNLERQKPTGRQVINLLMLLEALKYSIAAPHSLFKNTLCPGKNFPLDDVFDCLNNMKIKT